jgi:alpha-1,3-rhamnosyl/mannosyltransferase
MGFGTPVVVAEAASVPEVVGDAALTIKPGDVRALTAAMAGVLDDPALAVRLADLGRVRASELTWRHTAERTAVVYRQVIG